MSSMLGWSQRLFPNEIGGIMKSKKILNIVALAVVAVGCSQKCCEEEVPVVNATYVHRYGVAVPGDFWASSGQHGQVVTTLADGVVIAKTFNSGVLDGDTTYTFPHSSQIEKRETYSNGVVVNEIIYYFDGTPKQETVFESFPGLNSVSSWYLNGTPRSIEQKRGDLIVQASYFTINNQRDAMVDNSEGTRLIRDDYGQLLSTDVINGGQMVLRTTYFPNGSPRESIAYQNGVLHGEKKTFHPAGEPNSVETWENGQQSGMTTLYQHGERYTEVPYYNGQKHGVERRYRDGSIVVQEVSWNEGRLHGPSTTHVGDSVKTDYYYTGSPISENDFNLMKNRPIVK